MVKRILLLLFIFTAVSTAYSKDKWDGVEYHYSSGPVSPEYQYMYVIVINADGTGSLNYKKGAGDMKEASFRVSKKNINKLSAAITKSKILSVDPNEMKSDNMLIGGAESYASIVFTDPNPMLDYSKKRIEFPKQVNEKYSKNTNALYMLIENLVPKSTWDSVK